MIFTVSYKEETLEWAENQKNQNGFQVRRWSNNSRWERREKDGRSRETWNFAKACEKKQKTLSNGDIQAWLDEGNEVANEKLWKTKGEEVSNGKVGNGKTEILKTNPWDLVSK